MSLLFFLLFLFAILSEQVYCEDWLFIGSLLGVIG